MPVHKKAPASGDFHFLKRGLSYPANYLLLWTYYNLCKVRALYKVSLEAFFASLVYIVLALE